ncbi:uncharacterized protein N7459_006655 [Penicillium hispanicum]|uniref:uncharacterized protein n=1 Tax=Penicillium hispanicum TaxID=1080232 RepID=UPI0025419E37|nr:uncharacterized protein N7459_006655 [Penicillium hispanicum]KAJ5577691.1 hypothetical protein N7459_006655 [Penicillium hispanicum]
MASADSPPGYVCGNCKLRKKKCDKARPSCGYCTQKKLACQYGPSDLKYLTFQPQVLVAASSPIIRSSLLLSHTLSEVLMSEPKNVDSALYLQILRIIRTTGQSVDDMTVRYFRGIHYFMPIISRPRFHERVVDIGAPPPASFSMLLLSMCLITYHPEIDPQPEAALDPETLYMTTKTLFAQVQASHPRSLRLIQAGTMIATYEYASRRVHDALATIGTCARMGYAARIHLASPVPGTELYPQTEEEANTWWGIIICERTFFCELDDFQQPFTTKVPSREAPLPTEPGGADHSVPKSHIPHDSTDTSTQYDNGGFASVAQAAWLLDQVFKILEIPDLDLRLIQLDGLDHTLRSFLAVIMEEARGRWGSFCAANAIIERALFILHWHILAQVPHMGYCKHKSREQWRESSLAALDTLVTMTKDVTASQDTIPLSLVDILPPSCAYIILASLRHIENAQVKRRGWSAAEKQLRSSLQKFHHRWNTLGRQ